MSTSSPKRPCSTTYRTRWSATYGSTLFRFGRSRQLIYPSLRRTRVPLTRQAKLVEVLGSDSLALSVSDPTRSQNRRQRSDQILDMYYAQDSIVDDGMGGMDDDGI